MTRHYNPSLASRAARILNSKGGDYLTDEVTGPVAVISIDPTVRICKNILGTGNIFTTPSDKDFYLTAATMSAYKAVTDSGSALLMQITTDDGGTPAILSIQDLTMREMHDSVGMGFTPAIKIKRGTNISLATTGTWTAVRGQIQGYTEETTQN